MPPVAPGQKCHTTARGWLVSADPNPGRTLFCGEPAFTGLRPTEPGRVVGVTPGGFGLAGVETEDGRLIFRMGFELVPVVASPN